MRGEPCQHPHFPSCGSGPCAVTKATELLGLSNIPRPDDATEAKRVAMQQPAARFDGSLGDVEGLGAEPGIAALLSFPRSPA